MPVTVGLPIIACSSRARTAIKTRSGNSRVSFNHGDLLNIAKLAERAEEWITQQRAAPVQANGVAGDDDVPF